MLTSTPMGPAWLIFFQTKKDHYSWKQDNGKKKREEDEIIVLLTTMYETFN